ncbi:MAG TPA: lipid-A-disaccharide synthase N-terminal domain-containing protein [Phycisphaerales bacterium]|nr:lipid-A-disaccharide synthase N-terminal domain-containing protein [Phycisphaerales bacterium]
MKWEPIIIMVLVIGLGLWLVWGRDPRLPARRPGAETIALQIGSEKGELEILKGDSGRTYRFLFRDGTATEPPMTDEALERVLTPSVAATLRAYEPRWDYRLLNITSRAGLIWICVGFAAQLLFSFRFLIQWMVSEKKKTSTIPEIFWWVSLFGGIGLFVYFIWRRDPVGVLGQSSGLVVYARNIRLIHKQRRRARDEAARAAATPPPPPSPPPSIIEEPPPPGTIPLE